MGKLKIRSLNSKTFEVGGMAFSKGNYCIEYSEVNTDENGDLMSYPNVFLKPKDVFLSSKAPFKSFKPYTDFLDLNGDPFDDFEVFTAAFADIVSVEAGGGGNQDIDSVLAIGAETERIPTVGSLVISETNGAVDLNAVGIVESQSFPGPTLPANFTTTLTPTTEYTVSSGLNILAGGTVFNKYFQYEKPIAIGRWEQEVTIIVNTYNATSYGMALGLMSVNSIAGQRSNIIAQLFMHNDVALSGKIRLYRDEAGTIISTSTQALTFVVGNTINFKVIRDELNMTVIATNVTTGQAVTLTYIFSIANTSGALVPNAGKFRLYFLGGTYKVTNYTYKNTGFKNGLIFIGDSITDGYLAPSFANGFVSKVGSPKNWDIFGGQGDKSLEILNALPQLLNENTPTEVVLFIGTNDNIQSVVVATYKANMTSIVTQLEAAGVVVHIVSCVPVNSKDATLYVAAASQVSVEQGTDYLDAFALLKNITGFGYNPNYDGDGIHPNVEGHSLLASNIRTQFPSILLVGGAVVKNITAKYLPNNYTELNLIGIDANGNFYIIKNSTVNGRGLYVNNVLLT